MWLVATVLDNKDPSRLYINKLPMTITKQQDRLRSFRPRSLPSCVGHCCKAKSCDSEDMRNKMLTTQQLGSNRRGQESNRPFMNVPKDQTSSHQNLLKVLPPTNSTQAGNQALPHGPSEDIYTKPISQHWKNVPWYHLSFPYLLGTSWSIRSQTWRVRRPVSVPVSMEDEVLHVPPQPESFCTILVFPQLQTGLHAFYQRRTDCQM